MQKSDFNETDSKIVFLETRTNSALVLPKYNEEKIVKMASFPKILAVFPVHMGERILSVVGFRKH